MDVVIAFVGSAFLGSMITAIWKRLEGNGNSPAVKVMVLETEIHYLRQEVADMKKSIERLEKMLHEFLMTQYSKKHRQNGTNLAG